MYVYVRKLYVLRFEYSLYTLLQLLLPLLYEIVLFKENYYVCQQTYSMANGYPMANANKKLKNQREYKL